MSVNLIREILKITEEIAKIPRTIKKVLSYLEVFFLVPNLS